MECRIKTRQCWDLPKLQRFLCRCSLWAEVNWRVYYGGDINGLASYVELKVRVFCEMKELSFYPAKSSQWLNVEHITWSRVVYVLSFVLKSSGSITFHWFILFTACFKRNIHSLLGECILYVQLGKPYLAKTT